jgi:hypothetical protein
LRAEDDPGQVLEEIVRAAVELIPGAEEDSISLVTGRRDVATQHPTGACRSASTSFKTKPGRAKLRHLAAELARTRDTRGLADPTRAR